MSGCEPRAACRAPRLPGLAVVAGVVVAAAFVRRQRVLPDPFVDLGLFSRRTFAVAAATLAVGIFVLWASNYAIAQYLQLVEGLAPLDAGLWTAPSAVGVIVGSMLAPRLARTIDPARIVGVGLAVSAVGYVVLARADTLALVVSGAVVVSAGLGPMMALATDMVIGSAPPQRAGAAAAISTTAPQLGGAMGIAVMGSVIAGVYRARTDGTAPAGVPDSAVVAFEDNLSAAVSAARELPGPQATALLEASRDAFTHGFQVAAGVSAILVLGMAVVVVASHHRASARGFGSGH